MGAVQPPVGELIRLWKSYSLGADQLEARGRHTGNLEDLRKAVAFRHNVVKLSAALMRKGLFKGFPLQKRFKWKGLNVSIENVAGSARHWYDASAKRDGYTYMLNDYGYLRGTEGVDGDAVDAYFGPDPQNAEMVYVVRQLKAPEFLYYDEDKCMIGFSSAEAAKTAYLAHYDNPRFFGTMDVYPVHSFLQAVKHTKKAPAPVGGWQSLTVQQKMSDLLDIRGALPSDAQVFDSERADPNSPSAEPDARPKIPATFRQTFLEQRMSEERALHATLRAERDPSMVALCLEGPLDPCCALPEVL